MLWWSNKAQRLQPIRVFSCSTLCYFIYLFFSEKGRLGGFVDRNTEGVKGILSHANLIETSVSTSPRREIGILITELRATNQSLLNILLIFLSVQQLTRLDIVCKSRCVHESKFHQSTAIAMTIIRYKRILGYRLLKFLCVWVYIFTYVCIFYVYTYVYMYA